MTTILDDLEALGATALTLRNKIEALGPVAVGLLTAIGSDDINELRHEIVRLMERVDAANSPADKLVDGAPDAS